MYIRPSEVDDSLEQRYCVVEIGNKKGIVNCDTGKVIYDYTESYISVDDDNIFSISEKETYDLLNVMYIQDDKIVYQSSNKNIELSYYPNGKYIQIYDESKNYPNQYTKLQTTS